MRFFMQVYLCRLTGMPNENQFCSNQNYNIDSKSNGMEKNEAGEFRSEVPHSNTIETEILILRM